MEKEKILVSDLADAMLNAMESDGYSKLTIWGNTYKRVQSFVIYSKQAGVPYYSDGLVEQYKADIEKRYLNGEIQRHHRNDLRNHVDKLRMYHDFGRIEPPYRVRGTKYVLSDNYQQLFDRFISSLDKNPKATADISWSVRRYLHYLQSKGITDLGEAKVDDARAFLVDMTCSMKLASLKNLVGYLRQFQLFLNENAIPSPDCTLLFSVRIPREYPIYDYVHDDELEAILAQIDTTTPKGKRDYAIILLGALLGVRAGDIIHLKLADFNWNTNEIRYIQSKTGNPIVLPLLPAVAAAVDDYLQNARPNCDYEELFLRVHSPIYPFSSGVAIQYMFSRYANAAGIDRKPGDGKNFHGLRRRLGRNMVTKNVPMTTVAQVLGHQSFDSTRQYISLDSENLKICALDFRGILVEREELNG